MRTAQITRPRLASMVVLGLLGVFGLTAADAAVAVAVPPDPKV